MASYEKIENEGGVPIKAWVRGFPLDERAADQLRNVAKLPIVHRWVAAMPDVHWGIGATVGSVIPTVDAIIPAAVGVDIGCGMMAVRTSLHGKDLPDDLRRIRTSIEKAVPHGRTDRGGRNDRGSFGDPPARAREAWAGLEPGYKRITDRHPRLARGRTLEQLGTLGTGNHFIEVCLDTEGSVWVMLHSGSRGPGNRIGTHFIALAKKDMARHVRNLPDADLAYFREGSEHFDDYVFAVEWAQRYARVNRDLMMEVILEAMRRSGVLPPFRPDLLAVNCHHNYVAREHHYGKDVFVTRKGAVRAGAGDLGIIPGSMGARSYIVRGKGNPESFCSCSHGAGRALSRTEAKRRFSVEDHVRMTEGVECRKDAAVIDETPAAYKPIEKVMAAQGDLVEIVHELKQVVCVKGLMLVIDGSEGEGGGQILRTALGLALVTGTPVRLSNIRAGRTRPGLLHQHLTAVRAAVAVGGAAVEGDALHSGELTFTPGAVRGGDFDFDIGTAGSATLVLQTVLPALLRAAGPSTVTVRGGTHNPHAPPFEFLQECLFPLLRRMGADVRGELLRHGFYPAGGGKLRVAVTPSALAPLELVERGRIERREAVSAVANLPLHIADRELAIVAKELGWRKRELVARDVDAEGPGNVLTLLAASATAAEVVTGFGEKGLAAEVVARRAAKELRRWLEADVPVGEHLADQLLVPLALAGGGRFRTVPPSAHTRTNAAIIERFLPVRFRLGDDLVEVES